MKTSIGYDNLNRLLLGLLETNSPQKRLAFLGDWLIQCDYDRSQLEPTLAYLEAQQAEKVKQGSIGGKAPRRRDQETVIAVLKDLKDVIAIKTEPVAMLDKPKRKTKTAESYKRPIWVEKCAGVSCDECGDEIDGCAFRWKRGGEYCSWHPTCIPSRNKTTFEEVKGYRLHFGLDAEPKSDQALN